MLRGFWRIPQQQTRQTKRGYAQEPRPRQSRMLRYALGMKHRSFSVLPAYRQNRRYNGILVKPTLNSLT